MLQDTIGMTISCNYPSHPITIYRDGVIAGCLATTGLKLELYVWSKWWTRVVSHVLKVPTGREALLISTTIKDHQQPKSKSFTEWDIYQPLWHPKCVQSVSILLRSTLVKRQISTFYMVGSCRLPFVSSGCTWLDHSSTCAVLQIRNYTGTQVRPPNSSKKIWVNYVNSLIWIVSP